MQCSILDILRDSGDTYVSGEEMAKIAGVSRSAIWKNIQELRARGYEIDSRARNGYRLVSTPDILLPEEISYGLHTDVIGKKIIFFERTDSTNIQAKRIAADGAPDGTIIVAEEQNSGRGRLERQFFSPPGKGIWFSMILRPEMRPSDATKFTLASAVAVAEALDSIGLKADIKWPNDVLYHGKKLVGILTEMSAEIDRINYIVIGTGINVNIQKAEFPEHLKDIATSIEVMNGGPVNRVYFFQKVLEAFDKIYETILREGFNPIIEKWKKYALARGQNVKVVEAGSGNTFYGTVKGLAKDASLIISTPDGERRVMAGDVSVRMPDQKDEPVQKKSGGQ